LDELTLTYLGIGLGVTGIIATIVVAILVYKLQKRENESSRNILNKINGITENQARIIESIDNRSHRHIHWFIRNVGNSLESLIENYRELNRRIETYQTNREELHLKRIMGGIRVCRLSQDQLAILAERDIPLVATYLSNPWIAGKFPDIIPLLDTGLSYERDQIVNMKDHDFGIWKESISQRINEMEGYLQTIRQEEVERPNDPT
jgi:hypothetical protein